MTCRICRADGLEPVKGFDAFTQVTSDCRPWPAAIPLMVCARCGAVQKEPGPALESQAEKIYGSYAIHPDAGGAEQAVFRPGRPPAARSAVLLDWLLQNTAVNETGKLLDIGCGNGAALRTFGAKLANWEISGLDVNDRYLDHLNTIPNFRHLHLVGDEEPTEQFDVILSIHSFEHVFDPAETLRSIGAMLSPSGTFLIQVPNVETSPFDMLIADHVMHFSSRHLRALLLSEGWEIVAIEDSLVPKELSVLCRRGKARTPSSIEPYDIRDVLDARVRWLSSLLSEFRNRMSGRNNSGSLGVFGTANASAWLAGALDSSVDFFVDEDPSKPGTEFLGRPVLHPRDIPAGAVVLMPLPRPTAEAIAARYPENMDAFAFPPE